MGNPLGIILLIFSVLLVLFSCNSLFIFCRALWFYKTLKVRTILKGGAGLLIAYFIAILIINNPEYFELKYSKPNESILQGK